MERQHHRWYSRMLGRDMEMLVYGYAGARAIAFPTSMGRYWDWEDRGMVAALGDHLEKGWLQMYCVDSVDGESWYNRHIHPHDRAARHTQYDRYIAHEVVPFSTHLNPNPFLITTGASFGAYHALAFGLRHPEVTGRVLGMSGLYDVKQLTDGYSDDEVYFGNPFDFVLNEHDPARLDAMRRVDIILAVGRDDPACNNNLELSQRLWRKGVWHALRVWDGWAHDWPFWQRMVRLYIGGHD